MLLEELLDREQLIRDVCSIFYDIPLPPLKYADEAIDFSIAELNKNPGAMKMEQFIQVSSLLSRADLYKNPSDYWTSSVRKEVEELGIHLAPAIKGLYHHDSKTKVALAKKIHDFADSLNDAFGYLGMLKNVAHGKTIDRDEFAEEMAQAVAKKIGLKL